MSGDLAPDLRGVLSAIAARGEVVGYAALAAAISLAGNGRIARLGALLEATMAEDVAAGRPMIASALAARAGGGLPAPGYFAAATALGRYHGPPDGPAAAAFVAAERAALATGSAKGAGGRPSLRDQGRDADA